ncbi:MAG: arginine deiminase family protein [Alphaproteobacteria bacterium]|nr:arginine deiminase family protein [Alphaproteobacteria bacterium]
MKIQVSTEIESLKKLLVHFPDLGLARVVPDKAQDWLFEDIVDHNIITTKEYNYYIVLLLYFLDPELIKGNHKKALNNPNFFNPYHPDFHNSSKVIEIEKLLFDILQNDATRNELIAAIISYEECPYKYLAEFKTYSPEQLSKTFISGISHDNLQYFPPVPNFIFTRDIGIVVNDFLVLNKPAKEARQREALLMKYIFNNHPKFNLIKDKIIELDNLYPSCFSASYDENFILTLEGGDVMMVHPNHLLVGISERTSELAAKELVNLLFKNNVVAKITLVKIPKKRNFMHIDTVFTQVKKDTWVLYGLFKNNINKQKSAFYFDLDLSNESNHTEIVQYHNHSTQTRTFANIEDLLKDISIQDFGCSDAKIIYSGNDEYPFNTREQWTDSCNLLALKEGVVVGYDRNYKTQAAFEALGFECIPVQTLLEKFETNETSPEKLENTFILMPSAELSRARGGFHCMSMPLERKSLSYE